MIIRKTPIVLYEQALTSGEILGYLVTGHQIRAFDVPVVRDLLRRKLVRKTKAGFLSLTRTGLRMIDTFHDVVRKDMMRQTINPRPKPIKVDVLFGVKDWE